jgi:hypothetical protein
LVLIFLQDEILLNKTRAILVLEEEKSMTHEAAKQTNQNIQKIQASSNINAAQKQEVDAEVNPPFSLVAA